MKQYGLRTKEGTWLPRDGFKRSNGVRLLGPDLWQDKGRATGYASHYHAELVEFNVPTYVDRHGIIQAGHGKGEQ